MIATLPMYDRPETAAAHDALWAGIRDRLRATGHDAPDALNRDIGIDAGLHHPDLLLGQCCGLPFRAGLHDRLTLVGTGDYALDDAPPGHYRSVLVTRRGDAVDPASYADRVLAYNEALSHSGWAAPLAKGVTFGTCIASGGHRASAVMVADRRADIAAIDAITWRAIATFDAEIAGKLQVIGTTPASPGIAFVTAKSRDPDPLRRAIAATIAALGPPHRDTLGLAGMADIPAADYLAVPIPPAPTDRRASSG